MSDDETDLFSDEYDDDNCVYSDEERENASYASDAQLASIVGHVLRQSLGLEPTLPMDAATSASSNPCGSPVCINKPSSSGVTTRRSGSAAASAIQKKTSASNLAQPASESASCVPKPAAPSSKSAAVKQRPAATAASTAAKPKSKPPSKMTVSEKEAAGAVPKKQPLVVRKDAGTGEDVLDFVVDDFLPASKAAERRRTLLMGSDRQASWSELRQELSDAPFNCLEESSDIHQITDICFTAAKLIRRILCGRGKSVTKADKAEILRLTDGIEASTELVRQKHLRPAADLDTSVVADVVQTTMRKAVDDMGQMDLRSVNKLLDERMDAFKSDVQQQIRECIQTSISSSVQQLQDCVQTSIKESVPAAASTSYASAVGRQPSVPKIKTPVSRPALVIESTDESNKSHKRVLDAWKKDVTFTDTDFAPVRTQTVSNGKVRVEFDSVQQRDSALDKLASVTTLKSEASRRRRPLVIAKGMSKDVVRTDEDAVKHVLKQNPAIASDVKSPEDLKVKFKRTNRNDQLINVVFEVSPIVRVRMLEAGRLNFGHQRVRVQDFSPFLQCFRCLQFGHVQSNCASDVHCCSHCAATSHNVRKCPDVKDTAKLKCFNCVQHNEKSGRSLDIKHSATSVQACPRIRTMVERLNGRTDYSV